MSNEEIRVVQVQRKRIETILNKASGLKPDGNIEPPLTEADFGEKIWQLDSEKFNGETSHGEQTSYAAVETAFREKFYDLLVSLTEFSLSP